MGKTILGPTLLPFAIVLLDQSVAKRLLPTFCTMPKLTGVLILFLSLLQLAYAQRPADSTFYPTRPTTVPAHLKLIERRTGPIYYYGDQRLRSPTSLEIPFYELNNPTVNHYYRSFRTWNTVGQLAAVVPLAYWLFNFGSRSTNAYKALYFGSIAATVGATIVGNTRVRQAVTHYNEAVLQARFGLSAQPVPGTGRPAVGLGLVLKPVR